MDYNYHTHTWFCDHASGSPEEYIDRAIQNGIRVLGFSEHAPFRFPDGYQTGYRMPVERVTDYVTELSQLRDKYRGRIDIHIGFEMEYYPTYFTEMLAFALQAGAEYLILGQHFCSDERPSGIFAARLTDSTEGLALYVSNVQAAIKSGLFTYVAHPDYVSFSGDGAVYDREMRKICVAAREYNVPLEINFGGIRRGNWFPADRFWRIAGEEQAPVTFGFDAHTVNEVADMASLPRAEQLVKTYHLNYIGAPTMRPLKRG